MKRAVIYRRASTDGKKQAHSLSNQAFELTEFAASNGYEVVKDIFEYVSASKGVSRDGFNECLALLEQDCDLTLIAYDLTRLSRDIGNWSSWSAFLPRIRFATRGDVAISELEASILLVVSANESRMIGERVAKGIQRAKERALDSGKEWKWGGCPNPSKARAKLASNTKRWRETIRSVSEVLDERGITTLKAKCDWLNSNGFRSQRGKLIGTSTLHYALKVA